MGIIFGLVAAIGWGSADFVARFSSREIGAYRTLWYMQFIGLAVLTVYLLAVGEFARLAAAGWEAWAWGVIAAVLGIGGAVALYHSFAIGIISLVSPICASYAVITTILAVISGERLMWGQVIGILVTIVGVVLASTTLTPQAEHEIEVAAKRAGGLPPGVNWALAAAVCFGFSFWMFGFFVTPKLGGIAPVWLIRLTTVCLLPLLARPLRQSIALPSGGVWWLILGIGVLDTIGNLANTIGLTVAQAHISIVAVIGSLFSAVTVLLAAIFLRERLVWNQWLGIVIVLVGVALLNWKV